MIATGIVIIAQICIAYSVHLILEHVLNVMLQKTMELILMEIAKLARVTVRLVLALTIRTVHLVCQEKLLKMEYVLRVQRVIVMIVSEE